MEAIVAEIKEDINQSRGAAEGFLEEAGHALYSMHSWQGEVKDTLLCLLEVSWFGR